MASRCISSCVEDTRVPVRATYVNLYKWPESDLEFVRSMSSNSRNGGAAHPRVVDSISCRQMYLRSYTFSREEDEKMSMNCLGRSSREKGRRKRRKSGPKNSATARLKKKTKSESCSALACIFRRLLSCTTQIDVAD